jgi:hypothetical protein
MKNTPGFQFFCRQRRVFNYVHPPEKCYNSSTVRTTHEDGTDTYSKLAIYDVWNIRTRNTDTKKQPPYPDHGEDKRAEEERKVGGRRQRRQNVEPVEVLQNILVHIVVPYVDLLPDGDRHVEELREGEILSKDAAATTTLLQGVVSRRHGGVERRRSPIGDGCIHFNYLTHGLKETGSGHKSSFPIPVKKSFCCVLKNQIKLISEARA